MLNALLGGCVAPGRFSSTGFGSNMIFRQSGWMLTILVIASLAIGVANSQASQTDYQLGYTLGLEAYKYGIPLVTSQYKFEVQTSSVPVNKFDPYRRLVTGNLTTVVAPNFDTLYSIAWLDLSKEPQLIYVPNMNKFHGRYFVIPIYDPYTENFVNLGSVNRTPQGYYAVVGPNDANIALPKHVTRIKSKYNRVWIVERIYVNGDNPKDIDFVNRLQDRITLTPLSEFNGCGKGQGEGEPGPANPNTTANNPVMPRGMAYYDQLCQLLKEFPPPDADQAQLSRLAQIGVGPGLKPSTNDTLNMHSDIVAGMIDAVANGSVEISTYVKAMYAQGFTKHNGYLIERMGTYGTNYDFRAAINQIGRGALTPDEAFYPVALLDRTGQPLTGTKKYTVHIAAGSSPPINPPPSGFWSLTVYNATGYLFPNPIDRYVINDRTILERNSDGSVDLYLQSTPPSDQQNWLPIPAEPFQLIWRLYATQTNALSGIMDGISGSWQPPAVMPVS